MPAIDEPARVAYWIEHMERAHDLMSRTAGHPVRDCGEPFESIADGLQRAGVEATFSTTQIDHRFDRIFFIRQGLLPRLTAIGRALNDRGWLLKFEDGYRTCDMQKSLGTTPAIFDQIVRTCVREAGGGAPSRELVFRRSMVLVANIPATGTHLSGSAVDISVLRRDDGSEVWRGKPYLEMSEYTPMRSPFVSAQEMHNRLEITALMEQHSFMHYPGEFWHYNSGDAMANVLRGSNEPSRYGAVHWDRQTNQVTPYDDYQKLLNPISELEEHIDAALERLRTGVN